MVITKTLKWYEDRVCIIRPLKKEIEQWFPWKTNRDFIIITIIIILFTIIFYVKKISDFEDMQIHNIEIVPKK